METLSTFEIGERVLASLIAGAAIGLEREWANKPAGIRTYALVCEGSALFMITSLLIVEQVTAGGGTGDPTRIASTVVQGIGFLAGGVIFTRGMRVSGLTTAAGSWVVAAIGLAIGAGYYEAALVGVIATLITLVPLRWAERGMKLAERGPNSDDDEAAPRANGEANSP
jgi:putative Mg2+ transporter-C (MgtC) family protein